MDSTSRTVRRMELRHLFFNAMFFLGTILAAIGWIIEWKDLGEVSLTLAHLTVLALIGHVMQVIGAFGNLVTPDEIIDVASDSDYHEDHYNTKD